MMKLVLTITVMFVLLSCSGSKTNVNDNLYTSMKKDTITLGAGCFWCVEAIFAELKGVESVTPGYTDGVTKDPTYKEVCTGATGHNEVAQIVFDAETVSFDEILEIFWKIHDPTTLNRQGNDVGTQYRSGIYYHTEEQKEVATMYFEKLDNSGAWDSPLVTEIKPMLTFYKAENYHHDYYSQNQEQQYCKFVIQPKIEKFRKIFADKIK